MNIVVVTPPPFEPITVAAAYQQLRWDAETDDDSPPNVTYPLQSLIEGHIVTAREYAEKVTRRALIQQTLRITLNGFPSSRVRFGGRWDEGDFYYRPGTIELKRPPFISLVSVQYLDSNEVLQTLASSHYYVDSESNLVPVLVFRDTFDVSLATTERQDSVRITYLAGYPPEGSPYQTQEEYAFNVPQGIKDAMLLHVQSLADRFDPDERETIERARDALLNSRDRKFNRGGWSIGPGPLPREHR
jgi:hypothetical protein